MERDSLARLVNRSEMTGRYLSPRNVLTSLPRISMHTNTSGVFPENRVRSPTYFLSLIRCVHISGSSKRSRNN